MTTAHSETLGTPALPPCSQNPPPVPASHPPLATGPDRSQRVTRQTRLKAGSLPTRPKKKISRNRTSVASPQTATSSANTPTGVRTAGTPTDETLSVATPIVETPLIIAPQMDTLQPQVDTSTANPSRSVEPDEIGTPNRSSDAATSVPGDCDSDSDGRSYTSTLPEVFEVGMDDSGPQATGPWVAIDHLTGEMIIDDDGPTEAAPTNAQTGIEIGILPRLGVHILTEAEPPTLLFEDEDVRPEWLITAVKEFLRYTPYYGCLGKVVDLFLTQEERLGYPNLVINLHFSSKYSFTNTTPSPCVELFPPPIGPPKWGSSRSGPENILAATM